MVYDVMLMNWTKPRTHFQQVKGFVNCTDVSISLFMGLISIFIVRHTHKKWIVAAHSLLRLCICTSTKKINGERKQHQNHAKQSNTRYRQAEAITSTNNHNDKHNTQMQNLCKFEMIEIRNGNIWRRTKNRVFSYELLK